MELFDVVDGQGRPTGAIVSREQAHREGVRHRTAHVWILRKKDGETQILLQKRSENKDSHPGCYDISSAGHIPAGQEFVPAALRELKEELGVGEVLINVIGPELGVEAAPEQLVWCGQRRFYFESEFHGRPFKDNQVSNVYALWLDREAQEFTLQAEEVSEVRWFAFEDAVCAVAENRIPHCIYSEELELVRRGAVESAR